jgi:acetylornithine deacetylase/succinyl-diaminopimelate desuccinylase-like protein
VKKDRRPESPIDGSRLDADIANLREEFADKLGALVGIPSVSMERERHEDVRRCAALACQYLRELGADAEAVETSGLPLVLGRLVRDRSFPTVTIYNHLDVQPADGEGWRTSPFQLTALGDRYHGRGATDDKGPALVALLAARLAVAAGVRLNFQFLWECEEEVGSPSFASALSGLVKSRGLFTDSILVSDTIWPAAGRPAIPYGLRGLLAFLVRLQTGEKDVHSGTTGGAARNPVGELAALIADCYDARTGRVRIPGFYADVRQPSAAERRELGRSGLTRAKFKKAHELRALRSFADGRLREAIMTQPTFEVHGIVGGYRGPGVKTIVPHQAEAKLSCRLVPDQKPREVFRLMQRFVAKKCPDAKVVFDAALEPYIADAQGPFLQAASLAVEQTCGRKPALTREGGSIGAVVTMAKTLCKDVVLLGLSLPEDGYHAINESFAWSQAQAGIAMFYRYFHHLQDIGPGRRVAPR